MRVLGWPPLARKASGRPKDEPDLRQWLPEPANEDLAIGSFHQKNRGVARLVAIPAAPNRRLRCDSNRATGPIRLIASQRHPGAETARIGRQLNGRA